MENKLRVLFLCTGNSARSQMAEALLRYHAPDHFEVYSAGLEPKGVNPFTVQVMAERGIDISAQTSKSVMLFLSRVFIHTLITVCDHAEQNCPTAWPGIVRHLHWSFEDPAACQGSEEEKLEKFRQVRNQIEDEIIQWLQQEGIEPAAAKPAGS